MRSLALLVGLALLPLSVGCPSLRAPAVEYVQADLDFDALLSPMIERWIQSDTSLTVNERASLLVSVRAWQLMVNRAAEATGLTHRVTSSYRTETEWIVYANGHKLVLPVSVAP